MPETPPPLTRPAETEQARNRAICACYIPWLLCLMLVAAMALFFLRFSAVIHGDIILRVLGEGASGFEGTWFLWMESVAVVMLLAAAGTALCLAVAGWWVGRRPGSWRFLSWVPLFRPDWRERSPRRPDDEVAFQRYGDRIDRLTSQSSNQDLDAFLLMVVLFIVQTGLYAFMLPLINLATPMGAW